MLFDVHFIFTSYIVLYNAHQDSAIQISSSPTETVIHIMPTIANTERDLSIG